MANINGANIELVRRGKGRPILSLHPHIGLHGSDAFIARLAEHAEVIVPSHPGYGHSDLPAGMSTVDDIAYLYLDLLEALNLREVTVVARNREATALFAWNPYMYNPKLKARLHRIRVPALFLWGEADRFAPVEYGEAHSKLIPGARFELVKDAGHFPHIEQAQRVARRMVE